MSNRTIPVCVETHAPRPRAVRVTVTSPTESPGTLAIREHRNRLGLSVAQCARRAEVADRTWRRWEAGERVMPADLWQKVQHW